MLTWKKDMFRHMAVTVSDRAKIVAQNLSVLGSVVAAVCGSASLFAVFAGSHVLAEIYADFLGSGYDRKVIDYTILDLSNLERCLQNVSLSVFWVFGSVLRDRVHHYRPQVSIARRLGDVKFRCSSWHHYWRAVHAVAARGGQQLCACVASHPGLRERDWK